VHHAQEERGQEVDREADVGRISEIDAAIHARTLLLPLFHLVWQRGHRPVKMTRCSDTAMPVHASSAAKVRRGMTQGTAMSTPQRVHWR
jgi:hypothetical protein